MILLVAPAWATTWVVDAGGAGDFVALADGFAALADGDTLEVWAGSYTLADVISTAEGVSVVGEGSDVVTVSSGGAGGALITFQGAATVSGILFDGAGNTAPYGLRTSADSLLLQDVRFHGFWPSDGAISADAGGLGLERCAFVDDERGVTLGDATTVEIENTTFVGTYRPVTYTSGISALDLTVASSTFVDFFIGIAVGSGVTVRMSAWDNVFQTAGLAPVYFYDEASADLDTNLFYDYTARSGTGYITGTNAIEADPLFSAWTDDGDWTNDDFSPAPGSPALDVAAHAVATTDGRGVTRALDGDGDGVATADLGAWEWYVDADADGFIDANIGGDDCDDRDPFAFPGGIDGCADGIDQDCDGADSTVRCGPPDTGDSGTDTAAETGRPDTGESGGGESADSSGGTGEPGETAESGESGESAGESGETADSGETGEVPDDSGRLDTAPLDTGSPPPADGCGCGGGRGAEVGLFGALLVARRRRESREET